jgi:hypothetical protein
MPLDLRWEERGVTRRFHGDCCVSEVLDSTCMVAADPRFDRLLYSIVDYRDICSLQLRESDFDEMVAHGWGSLQSNPGLFLIAIATQPHILPMVERYHAFLHGYATAIVADMDQAMLMVSQRIGDRAPEIAG